MAVFGKKLAELRKERNLSQGDLAKQMGTSISVISRYEREEMIPSIANAMTIADLLDTTVGYLLGETEETDALKDPSMLKRINEISGLPIKEKEALLLNVDAFLRDYKTRRAYAS